MSTRTLARLLAVGRVAIGAAFVAAPRPAGRAWLGEVADRDATTVLARGLGARDAVLALIALHTLDHSEIGPRWQRTLAACDLADLGATLAARRGLAPSAVAGTVAVAGGAAALELWIASRL